MAAGRRLGNNRVHLETEQVSLIKAKNGVSFAPVSLDKSDPVHGGSRLLRRLPRRRMTLPCEMSSNQQLLRERAPTDTCCSGRHHSSE